MRHIHGERRDQLTILKGKVTILKLSNQSPSYIQKNLFRSKSLPILFSNFVGISYRGKTYLHKKVSQYYK